MGENKFIKFDKAKLRYDLISTTALNELAQAYTYGALKYSDRNMSLGTSWSRYYAAAQRHLNLFWHGEDHDKESRLLHLSQALWNIATLIDYYYDHPDLDDRHKPAVKLQETIPVDPRTLKLGGTDGDNRPVQKEGSGEPGINSDPGPNSGTTEGGDTGTADRRHPKD